MRSRCGKVSISAHAPVTICCSPRTDQGEVGRPPKTLRQVAFGVATFDMHIGNDTSFTLQQTGYLGGQVPRQADGSTNRTLGSYTNSQQSRWVDEHPNSDWREIRERGGLAHRGDLVQGPNGDLWSILFQLIDERSGVTDFIKVKSPLEDAGPSVIKQNKIAFHHMLANSLAGVVAEDLNLERKAKWAERVGVGGGETIGFGASGHLGQEKRGWRHLRTRPSVGGRNNMHAVCFQPRWWTSWPTKAIYLHVTTKVCDAKFAMCTEHTSNSDFGAVTLVCHGQTLPRSSPNSKIRKDSSSTRLQETRHGLDQSGARNKTTSKHDEKELLHCTSLGYRATSSAHTVTRNITLCLFLLSLNLISHTLINVVTTPFLKLPSRVAKVIMF